MAAVDFFLKIEGIAGESQDHKHKDEIEIESWSWGATQAGSSSHGSGGGAGKVSMQDFHFTMKVNKSSPKLMLACAQGEHIKGAMLVCRKAGKEAQEFLKYKFSDLLISSYTTGGHGGSDIVPVDQISFNFSKIEVEFYTQKADGGVVLGAKAGYDVKANKAV